jgi:hypothetical protein
LPNHGLEESGDPNNDDRAGWADIALKAFSAETGQIPALEIEDIVCDLLCDLGHFCDRHHINLQDQLGRAEGHYNAETRARGEQFMRGR